MGAVKLLWQAEQERICDEFAREWLTKEEAISALKHLGFDRQEANDMLDGAIA